jgi:hypothetical protein
MWATLAHTDVGFTSDRFDWVSDPKLFLVTVASEIKEYRDTKKSKKFKKIVKNIFNPLTIDWESGWDELDERSATDIVTEMLDDHNVGSELFKKYDHYCIDLLQSLIILPIEQQSYKNIDKAYIGFLEEFIKIENEINSPFYNLYILKEIVDTARNIRSDYERKEQIYINRALKIFKDNIFNKIHTIAKFVQLKNVKFEKMLCSLLVLTKNIEGVLYEVMTSKMKDKAKEYKKLPVQNIEQMMGILQVNLPDEYIFTEDTSVCIINSITGKSNIVKIPVIYLKELNNTQNISQGSFLYNIV